MTSPVTYQTAEEGDVVEGRVAVAELESEQFDDQRVIVLCLCAVILCGQKPKAEDISRHTSGVQPNKTLDDEVNGLKVNYLTPIGELEGDFIVHL